jgi:hypothetical protein
VLDHGDKGTYTVILDLQGDERAVCEADAEITEVDVPAILSLVNLWII